MKLNELEMARLDLPPHFGAWTLGRSGDNPAYCSFLPNALHNIPMIAMNMSAWAMGRARWANHALASMGVTS